MTYGHNSSRFNRSMLPVDFKEMADCIGESIVFRIIDHFAGQEIRVPQKLKPDHKLLVLGEVDAKSVCEYCAGDTLFVPNSLNKKWLARLRQERLLEMKADGIKPSVIAEKLGITQRHVRRLCNVANSNTPDPNQMDMFSKAE